MENDIALPLSRVAAFMRQHTHDVRNHLNALDLEAALLADIVTDNEAIDAVRRLRVQIRETANSLRTLSSKMSEPQPSRAPLAARELFLIWQDEGARLGLESIAWTQTLGLERVNVDAGALAKVCAELLTNAKQFGDGTGLVAMAAVSGGKVCFELREQGKSGVDPTTWGSAPFFSTRRGAYGLGLWEADRIVRANGGTIAREVLSNGTLVTKLAFPVE